MSKTLTLLATLLIGNVALAQKDTVQTHVLDEVVVTANKMEQKQSTTGKVISVISKEQIEKSTGKTVAQILNEQAGIVINGALSNQGSVQTVFMRGGASGRTLILMDGVPVNDPSQIGNDFDLNFLSLNDVERIEVCKGAQSTLYGSDAIAGVINIITTKANITTPANAKATVSAGSFGTFKTNVQFYGKSDKFTYTMRYAGLRTNGFSSAYDSTGTRNFDKDGYRGNIVNAMLQYQATQHLMLKGYTQFSQYTAAIDASAFTDKSGYNINNKNSTSGIGFLYKNSTLALTGNYQYIKQHRNYDDNASTGAAIFSMNDYDAVSQFAELYTSVKLGGGFTLLAGADYRYGSMNNQYRSVSSFGPFNSQFRDTAMHQESIYSSINFTRNKFSVELGGRWNKHSRYGTNYTYSFNPSFAFDEHYRIFGSISSAFKAPTLYQLYATGGTGNPDLQPETAVNYEFGVQQTYKRFRNRLVFFYRPTTSGIDYNSVSFKYFNYVRQNTTGIEYEFTVQPTEKLTVTGNYTLISAEEITQSRINFKDTTYNYSLRRPKHVINANIGYQFTKGFYASVSGKYVGARNDVGAYKKPDVALESYFIAGAYAEYKFGELLKVFIDFQNIGNKKFFDIRGYNGIPTVFNLGATLNL
jgi:vitamin B12 transporter